MGAGTGRGTFLAHGMGKEPVVAFWPPISDDEAADVLARYPAALWPGAPGHGPKVVWRSPRPMSAAALVSTPGGTFFLKRQHARARSAAQLEVEHAFARHLRRYGQPVPAVLSTELGSSVLTRGELVYEAHTLAPGVDLYRDALSWSGFASTGHAFAAGEALARFHIASASFDRPERPLGILVNSTALVRSPDLLGAVASLCRQRPGLARALKGRPVREDFGRHLAPLVERAAPLLADLPAWWGHGDWHASNLTWTTAGPTATVAGIIDLGLANRTFAPHDLALAIERNCIDWLDLAGKGTPEADWATMEALVAGYQYVRPLSTAESRALVALLPVCHVEHALSEMEYFDSVVGSAAEADLAYHNYLLGHVRWFEAGPGRAVARRLGELALPGPGLRRGPGPE